MDRRFLIGGATLLLVTAASTAAMGAAMGQAEELVPTVVNPVGDWLLLTSGKAGEPKVVVHLARTQDALSGSLDVPDKGAMGVTLAHVISSGERLSFDVPQVSGHFEGGWSRERQAYVGRFTSRDGPHSAALVRGRLPPSAPVDWTAAPVAGLNYTPAAAAKARTGLALPVGKCVNMSNMLEAPKEGDWGPAISEDDFRIIRAAGFATVRIPVSWSTHASPVAPYTIDPRFLQRVHHVVDLATTAGLNVILNVHHYNELFENPEAHAARFAALWTQIAASFAHAPPSVWFELLNEPHDKLTNANLAQVLDPALAAVRATNPTRPILIGGEHWSNLQSLETLYLPDDPYVVPTFHYYDPFAFTSQGQSWMAHPPPFGRAYGSADDKAELDRDLAELKSYMARTGRVPIMGEYGVTDDPRLPLDQRVRYYHTISTAFASLGVFGCAWGYRNSFKLWDGHRWLPGPEQSIEAPLLH